MTKGQTISMYFRYLVGVSVLVFFIGQPAIGLYSSWPGRNYWLSTMAIVQGILFVITLIVTFFAYSKVFKIKRYQWLYLTLGILLISTLFLFVVCFHLVEVFQIPLNFFVSYFWLFVLILEGFLSTFLLYHTYLKVKSDELEDLHPTHRTLKFTGVSILIAGFFLFTILVWAFVINYTEYSYMPILVILFCTSLPGSFMTIERGFGVFGSFKKYKDETDLSLKVEILVFLLSCFTASGISLGFIGISLLG
ncbi:MAG: hypothetical protein HWN66_08125 [Candidatus Helarchaeota archaeon]|nr:hypothetical protein [Candidatus Helarchaeota archaeon]